MATLAEHETGRRSEEDPFGDELPEAREAAEAARGTEERPSAVKSARKAGPSAGRSPTGQAEQARQTVESGGGAGQRRSPVDEGEPLPMTAQQQVKLRQMGLSPPLLGVLRKGRFRRPPRLWRYLSPPLSLIAGAIFLGSLAAVGYSLICLLELASGWSGQLLALLQQAGAAGRASRIALGCYLGGLGLVGLVAHRLHLRRARGDDRCGLLRLVRRLFAAMLVLLALAAISILWGQLVSAGRFGLF